MPQITKRLEFDAGHRVLGHEGKCRNIHGHRYAAEITVASPKLDDISRVVDFSVIKTKVGGWIDDNWDHSLLLNQNDPIFDICGVASSGLGSIWDDGEALQKLTTLVGRQPFVMPNGQNPTAEVMAKFLFHKAQELLPNLWVVNVRLFETPTSSSDYPGLQDYSIR